MAVVLSPEQDLLVRAAQPLVPAGVTGDVRWSVVVDAARWHRLSGLLRRYLKAGGGGTTVPAAVTEELRDATRDTAKRNLQRQAELHTVLAALAAEEIPAMLLKGAALIESVYPEVGLRPMQDLDILVPRAAIHRAQAAVQDLGYQTVGGKVQADAEEKLRVHHHHFPLMKGGGVAIELHHHVLFEAPPSFDISGYWARARPAPGPVPHLLPSPEDLLLHVALHFTQDRIFRAGAALGQLADMAWIAHRHDVDWDLLAATAGRSGVADWTFLALYAATSLLGEIAPAAFLAAVRPSSFRAELGEQFIRQRVLPARTSVPLEQLAAGPRPLLFPTRHVLDTYVRPDESHAPSLARLRARRFGVLIARALRSTPRPAELAADLRLSRWMTTLRP
jgi:hypothetical protein